jgi:hypothetical protein
MIGSYTFSHAFTTPQRASNPAMAIATYRTSSMERLLMRQTVTRGPELDGGDATDHKQPSAVIRNRATVEAAALGSR